MLNHEVRNHSEFLLSDGMEKKEINSKYLYLISEIEHRNNLDFQHYDGVFLYFCTCIPLWFALSNHEYLFQNYVMKL